MDSFAEQLIVRQPDQRDRTKKLLICGGAVLIAAVSVLLVILTKFPFLLLATCALLYGAYYLLSSQSVEYEYTVTNDELDIDKIIARRRRVPMISVNIRKFERFAPAAGADDLPAEATLVMCADNTGAGEYCADLTTEAYGLTRICFTPNEKILAAIQAALPPALRRRAEYAQKELQRGEEP